MSLPNGDTPAFPAEAGGVLMALGLSKREHIATLILAGLSADSDVTGGPMDVAQYAIDLADALLAALEGNGQ